MEITERLNRAKQALERFSEVVNLQESNEFEKDSLFVRFEFTLELLLQCGRDYLRKKGTMDTTSSAGIVRALQANNLFSGQETATALKMVQTRNILAHTNDENEAKRLSGSIQTYYPLMQEWLKRMS